MWNRRHAPRARAALVARRRLAARTRWSRGVAGSLLGELAIRLVLGEQPKFARHVVRAPWGIRYNDPSSRYRHRSADVDVEFAINRQGMRCDHDVEHAKPAGRRRIVSLGDSFTIGYEVAATETFSSVLEARLRAAGLDVEVLNCGVSGFSNAEECLYLERELLNYSPDLVLVSFFDNDLDDNIRTGLSGRRRAAPPHGAGAVRAASCRLAQPLDALQPPVRRSGRSSSSRRDEPRQARAIVSTPSPHAAPKDAAAGLRRARRPRRDAHVFTAEGRRSAALRADLRNLSP